MPQHIFLADTNVLSEFVNRKPHSKVMQWAKTVELMAVSVLTIEEAHFGLAWKPHPKKLASLTALLRVMHKVYPVTESIAQRAGFIRGQFQSEGIIRSTPDMLIAATAQEHQLIVATRNVKDFLGCGVQVVNPFEYSGGD